MVYSITQDTKNKNSILFESALHGTEFHIFNIFHNIEIPWETDPLEEPL